MMELADGKENGYLFRAVAVGMQVRAVVVSPKCRVLERTWTLQFAPRCGFDVADVARCEKELDEMLKKVEDC